MLCWFFFFFLIDLFKQICNTSLCNSICLSIRIFSSFHSKCFTTSSLSISKNSPVIALYNFSNETRYAKTFIHIILIMLLIKNLIKIIYLPSSKACGGIHLISVIISYFYLIVIVRKYFTNLVTCTSLMI